jgi:hypothetical protein
MSGNTEFERAAETEPLPLLSQFWLFLRDNKKWWLLPIVLVLAMMGLLSILAGTGAAPFIYTMF